jgi:hypothetical protein
MPVERLPAPSTTVKRKILRLPGRKCTQKMHPLSLLLLSLLQQVDE